MAKNTNIIRKSTSRRHSTIAPTLLGIALMVMLTLVLALPATFALDVPPLKGRVNDYANMISPAARESLEGRLAALEKSDSTQIVILTVNSLKGEPMEDYGIKVAEAWKIGQKGKDNGIIFLVSKSDRKMRIEVGRGFEGKITDLAAGRIIDNIVKPRFKQGDYDGGYQAAMDALIKEARGEYTTAPTGDTHKAPGVSHLAFLVTVAIVAIMALAFLIAALWPGNFGGGYGTGAGYSSGGGSSSSSSSSYSGGGYSGGSDSGGGFNGGGGDFGGGGASGGW